MAVVVDGEEEDGNGSNNGEEEGGENENSSASDADSTVAKIVAPTLLGTGVVTASAICGARRWKLRKKSMEDEDIDGDENEDNEGGEPKLNQDASMNASNIDLLNNQNNNRTGANANYGANTG